MSYYVIAVLVLKIQLLSLQPCEGVLTSFRRWTCTNIINGCCTTLSFFVWHLGSLPQSSAGSMHQSCLLADDLGLIPSPQVHYLRKPLFPPSAPLDLLWWRQRMEETSGWKTNWIIKKKTHCLKYILNDVPKGNESPKPKHWPVFSKSH